jgi:hypothetical protein
MKKIICLVLLSGFLESVQAYCPMPMRSGNAASDQMALQNYQVCLDQEQQQRQNSSLQQGRNLQQQYNQEINQMIQRQNPLLRVR